MREREGGRENENEAASVHHEVDVTFLACRRGVGWAEAKGNPVCEGRASAVADGRADGSQPVSTFRFWGLLLGLPTQIPLAPYP